MTQLTSEMTVVSIAKDKNRRYTIDALTSEGIERLGPFDTPASAWAALDELDAPAA